jgi:predicted ATP-grasp superfamily ATP-dependent carboligase
MLAELASQLGAHVLLPVTDQSVDAVLTHRAFVPPGVVVPYPDLETYRRASDKLCVLNAARGLGFEVPGTIVLHRPADLEGAGSDAIFPAFVKPYRSLVVDGGVRAKTHTALVSTEEECRDVLARLPPAAFPVLLQRRLHGPGEGLFVLRWAGRVIATFAHRRLREKPPWGGVSVYRESVVAEPTLLSAGIALLEALSWEGVAMIECKLNTRTGKHAIMEVNGRLWGSLQLAIDAGVDFPTLLVACALHGDAALCSTYRVGVRSRWFWGDVDHLYIRLRRPSTMTTASEATTSRFRAISEFLRIRPGRDRSEVFRWRDPLPFLRETAVRLGVRSSS